MGDGFEHEVQALARQIAAAGASERAHLFHLGRWSERVLDWALSHPGFKTELFRFVDVFPACRDDADVLRHLSEYFAGVEVPRALGLGLEVAERVPFGARLSTAAARRNIMRMARQLIAGATPEDALPRLAALWRAGEACTVDLLGEKTVTEREAARYAAGVGAMLDALVAGTREWPAAPHLERDPWGPVPRVNLSVKPTALSALFAPASARDGLAEARERLLPILRRAREAGATVHLDMEHDDVKDLTLELLRGLGAEFPDGPQLGCVIQAYRKDAFADLRAVVAWSERALRLPLAVRLVKGAYWDFETVVAAAEGWPVPVFEAKAETDASYERCGRHLVEHAGRVRPAFGSHNLRSIAYAVACARARGLPPAAVEHQLLYGMAEPVHAALRRLGFRVRVYAPVGDLVAGMAYLVRRLVGNTSNESFIRHRFVEGQALEALIAPPAVERLPEPSEAAERLATDPADPGPFANEPHAELRRPHVRARLEASVVAAPARFAFEAPVLIDGRPVATAAQIVSVDPGQTSTVVCRSGRAGPEEAVRALAAAARAWPAWRATPWAGRAAVLFRAAAIMRRRRAELAGLPPGALAFLPGVGEEVGPALVDHPATAFVAFTGSQAVGLSLLERAAVHRPGQRHVKRVIAEMGGKNAIVVDADADLDQAVPAIVASAFAYAGQKCSAAARVIVVGPVFEELLERLVGATAIVPVGHARELRTVVGLLIDEEAYRRVREYQTLARDEGEVVCQRSEVSAGGWYVGPMVVVARDPRARIASEEIFGPLLTVLRADDFEHALALANDTDYALTGGLFSRSPVRIRRAADEFRAGNLYVNRAITGARVGRQPFGGYGLSGVGSKAGGPDYLLQFVEPRTVTENTIRQGFAPVE